MKRFLVEREQIIPRPREEVFRFFSDAANLERLTPAFLRFSIISPKPIAMRTGALIDYRILLFGVPVRWRTRIEEFEPGRRFVDLQLSGPYRFWRHTHEFFDHPGGTRMTDRVEYEVPLGPLGVLAREVFVGRTLERIFDYRRDTVADIFGGAGLRDAS